jgi:magnesium transporter
LIVKSVKLDPAVVANPFITTIVDALALIVYFALASHLIPILMT